jgi:hypothetical protein
MRKTILTLVAALAVAFTISSPASAGGKHQNPNKPLIITGAVVGTLVGLGLYDGWFSASTTAQAGAFARSGAGAATGGFLAGVATIAILHAATTPCQGFHALFQGAGCRNGKPIHAKRHVHRHHGPLHVLFWWL